MKPQRVFITGATGYVGCRLIPPLIQRGYEVHALVRQRSTKALPAGCRLIEGNPLDTRTFAEAVAETDTFVQLIGTPKPAPWKGPAFRAVDLVSGQASIEAATSAAVGHFIYVSVAHPAPVMKAYIAVRRACEEAIYAAGLRATILRPWYILGPGHWWPLALLPVYKVLERLPRSRDAARRLGLVTIEEMLAALVWAVQNPPSDRRIRIIEVPEIRRLGKYAR